MWQGRHGTLRSGRPRGSPIFRINIILPRTKRESDDQEGVCLAALDHELRAVAIMLDFMNPVLPLRRLINWRSKLWLDEPEPGGYHQPVAPESPVISSRKARLLSKSSASLIHVLASLTK